MVSLVAALVLLVALTLVWIVSVLERNAGIVDIFWGFGFVLVAWACAYDRSFELSLCQWLLVAMVSAWGLRLTAYLGWRNLAVYSEEDYRYQSIRARVGPSFWWSSFFVVFLVQGALLYTVAMPVQAAVLEGRAALDAVQLTSLGLGVAAWLVGLSFETIGDWQLSRFKANPDNAGEVMDRGLWRYTRHPNYFGDFCVWWGHFGVAAALGAPWWTAVGPVIMSILLMRVSGVPLLERKLTKTRPGYEDYTRRTSAFFPRPPRA